MVLVCVHGTSELVNSFSSHLNVVLQGNGCFDEILCFYENKFILLNLAHDPLVHPHRYHGLLDDRLDCIKGQSVQQTFLHTVILTTKPSTQRTVMCTLLFMPIEQVRIYRTQHATLHTYPYLCLKTTHLTYYCAY